MIVGVAQLACCSGPVGRPTVDQAYVTAKKIEFRHGLLALVRILSGAGLDPALEGMLLNVYHFTLLTFGVIMAVNQLGINVGAALAGLGVVGLTIEIRRERHAQQYHGGFPDLLGQAISYGRLGDSG